MLVTSSDLLVRPLEGTLTKFSGKSLRLNCSTLYLSEPSEWAKNKVLLPKDWRIVPSTGCGFLEALVKTVLWGKHCGKEVFWLRKQNSLGCLSSSIVPT